MKVAILSKARDYPGEDRSPCPLCQGSPSRVNRLPAGFPLATCGQCGLLYQTRRPQPEDLLHLYEEVSYCAWGMEDPTGSVREMKRATIDLHLDLLEQEGWHGSLLDLGCGPGFLVERAIERGWDAYGVEFSPVASDEARKRIGEGRVVAGPFERVQMPRTEFDAITLFDFLEHVSDPGATLDRARALLRPGGALMLTTPFVGGFSYYLMGRRWSQFKEEHLQYFSRRSLSAALDRAGFEVLSLRSARKGLSVAYICRHMALYPHPLLTPLAKVARTVCGERGANKIRYLPAGDLLALSRRPG